MQSTYYAIISNDETLNAHHLHFSRLFRKGSLLAERTIEDKTTSNMT